MPIHHRMVVNQPAEDVETVVETVVDIMMVNAVTVATVEATVVATVVVTVVATVVVVVATVMVVTVMVTETITIAIKNLAVAVVAVVDVEATLGLTHTPPLITKSELSRVQKRVSWNEGHNLQQDRSPEPM